MSQNRPNAFSGLRMGGTTVHHLTALSPRSSHADRVAEVIREKVQDGLTGETKEMQYTQCKIVGNGSFGVVFQTKLSPSGEDAAIKRVLQDKRFKVRILFFLSRLLTLLTMGSSLTTLIRTENCRSCGSSVIQTLSS